MLKGKHILVGISGSIAAYKSAFLVRLLIKAGAEVQVVMTESACEFITPLTLSTLSKKPVYTSFYKTDNGEWNNHVDLALWADYMLIAPASANTMAKMAGGICDNLLMAVYLSAKCPVLFAPAMDLDMYRHPATRDNIDRLLSFGNKQIAPGNGELASGLWGEGRMAEPEEIIAFLEQEIAQHASLAGRKILITAGPTYESIDPVRFIGNHSSGRMGYLLAEECAARGAEVQLVSGPTHLSVNHPRIHLSRVQSAGEMYERAVALFEQTDIAIMSAAVADYTPVHAEKEKIKKKEPTLVLELQKTKDIAAELGRIKKASQILVGFALETEHELANAQAKLESKNADLVVLNSLKDEGAGFGGDTNKITILSKHEAPVTFPLKSKKEVAKDIIDQLSNLIRS